MLQHTQLREKLLLLLLVHRGSRIFCVGCLDTKEGLKSPYSSNSECLAKWLETPNDHFSVQKYLQLFVGFLCLFSFLFGVANIYQFTPKRFLLQSHIKFLNPIFPRSECPLGFIASVVLFCVCPNVQVRGALNWLW